MTINEYQKLAMTTLNKELNKKDVLINGVMGLCGESGEAIDIVKKHLAQGHELDRDALIFERIKGEDCTYFKYIEQPERLCDIMAELLFKLHNEATDGCPVADHGAIYCKTVEDNYKKGVYDPTFLDEGLGKLDAAEAFKFFSERKHLLKNDTLLHGDYCLPNIMLDDFA